jgi:hypothetical protein
MEFCELEARFRKRADDAVAPYFSDSDTVRAWFNEATAEACIRARLIFDTTSSFCTIPISADQAVYTLDPCIDRIAAAWLTARQTILEGTDQSALDRGSVGPPRHAHRVSCASLWGRNWRTRKGSPVYYVQDGRRLQLVPIPAEADTLNLSVYRIPTDDEQMDTPSDEPAIEGKWHERLIDWALFRAYDDKDGEENDDSRARLALARFEQSFGLRPDANVERKRNERRARTTTINWP